MTSLPNTQLAIQCGLYKAYFISTGVLFIRNNIAASLQGIIVTDLLQQIYLVLSYDPEWGIRRLYCHGEGI